MYCCVCTHFWWYDSCCLVAGGGAAAALGAANVAAQGSQLAALPGTRIPNNAASVAYFDESGQVLLS